MTYRRQKNVLVISSNYNFKEQLDLALVGSNYNILNAYDMDMAISMTRMESPDIILVDCQRNLISDDQMYGFYMYGGSAVETKPILIFTDDHQPTYSVRGRPVEILQTSIINKNDLAKIIMSKLA